MTSGIRRTAEGIELTGRAAKGLAALASLLFMLAVLGANVLAKSEQIDNAVAAEAFYDTTRAIRKDITAVSAATDSTSRKVLAMQCRMANYPDEFCGGVPRATGPVQAGTPRGGR